jgi:hypothetical protein
MVFVPGLLEAALPFVFVVEEGHWNRGPLHYALIHYGPMTRSPSFDGFVDRLSGFSFLPADYPSYRVPDCCPGGIASH